MTMKAKVAFCTTLIFVLSSAVLAQTVYVNYNHNADFTHFKTYAWGQNANPNAIQDSIMMQTTQQDVDSQLTAKGLQKVQESQNPDLIVVASGGMKNQTSYNEWGTGGWALGGGMSTVTPETTHVGTLVVDIYDANGKKLIWRGISQGALSNKGEKNEKKLSKSIEKMFKQYP
jgi:hypothetical protein